MRRLIGLAIAMVGCSAEPEKVEPRPAREARDVGAPAVPPATPLPAEARQLLLGVVDDWEDVTAELQRFERAGQVWKPVGERWPAVIGSGGSGWGRGLHGQGAPGGRSGPAKREGDGKSPAGAFALGASFGYAARPVEGARAPYTQVDDSWVCVDDPRSAHYNRVLDAEGVKTDWSSNEQMRRHDELYRWVVLVDHNQEATAGAGSCIFLHLWRDADAGTAGCTAMDKPAMERLLAWLDPAARPAFVLLPAGELAALRESWALP
ncbi:MAG TPA: hypothetical protein VNO33_16845 [Kofleriaceae bacterium]|nr:hypothetical protein [Kofleriaceae bacterium]